VNVDTVQEEYLRYVTLLDVSDLGDQVKTRYRESLEELVCSTYPHTQIPLVGRSAASKPYP